MSVNGLDRSIDRETRWGAEIWNGVCHVPFDYYNSVANDLIYIYIFFYEESSSIFVIFVVFVVFCQLASVNLIGFMGDL